MKREIRLSVTIGDSDAVGARNITACLENGPVQELGTLTPWPGTECGPPFRFWGLPIGRPHVSWVAELESKSGGYASVEEFLSALKDALLPRRE